MSRSLCEETLKKKQLSFFQMSLAMMGDNAIEQVLFLARHVCVHVCRLLPSAALGQHVCGHEKFYGLVMQ